MIQIGEKNIAVSGLLDGHRSDYAVREFARLIWPTSLI
jgi:hypothetical protein